MFRFKPVKIKSHQNKIKINNFLAFILTIFCPGGSLPTFIKFTFYTHIAELSKLKYMFTLCK